MTTAYIIRFLLLLSLFLASLTHAQSLEDKLSQARKLEAESAMGGDAAAMDSILMERRRQGKAVGNVPESRAAAREALTLDSMLAGPVASEDSLQFEHKDSVFLDSTGKTVRKRFRVPALPKRYEQRVFRSVDRSVFSSARGAAGRDYVLGPGDEVTVSIWGDKEKEYNLTLNRDGKIFLEGIGQVQLAGQNVESAQQVLKKRLSRIYSGINRGTTQVDISLGDTGPIRIFVLGDVKEPGGYVLTGNASVLSALYFAKGPTDIGTVRNMVLTRSGNKHSLDLYQYLLKGESLSPHTLRDGDILFLGRAEALVEISGDVGRPATYELKKGEGVKELLEFAGGLNASAATNKLTLQRIFPDGKPDYLDMESPQDYLSGKAKMELRDGDKIQVEKSAELARNFLTINGPVKYPGTYEATGITSVVQLVERAGGLREDAFLSRVHVVRFKPEGTSNLFAYSLDSTLMESIPLQPRDNVILYSVKDMYLPDSVEISGAVFNPGKYEYRDGMTVKDLIMQAGGELPHHETGKALVFRGTTREHSVEQIKLNFEETSTPADKGYRLSPNDFVQIPVDPNWYIKEIVSLEGLFLNPGKYALLYPGEKISSVIQRAGGFKPNAYVEGGRFFRSKDSVGRVGVEIRNAVAKPKSKSNIQMVGGDSIYIPERLNTVKVIGEVGFETSVLHKDGATVAYYIEKAGGFTRRSEKDRVVVQYANGETSGDGYFNRKPDAGSVIYVPQGPEPVPVNWVSGLNILIGTLTAGITLILLTNQLSK